MATMAGGNDPLVIGVNGGGTHTTLALMDSTGKVLSQAEVGGSNPNYIGIENAQAVLQQGIKAVLGKVPLARVTAIGAGLAGIDRPADEELFRQIFTTLYPGKLFVLDNDAVAALVAGVGRRFGVVNICGTGMISLGIDAQGKRARSGGWGHYIDHGSGYAIGRDTLHAIARAHDGSGPETGLTARVLSRLGLRSATDLITWVYDPARRVDQIAALAAETVALAEAGDRVALRIIVRAVDALTSEVINVIRRLGFDTGPESEPIPVLLSGGLFAHSALFRDLYTSALQAAIPNAAPFITENDAAVGAAIMALEALGISNPPQPIAVSGGTAWRATEQRHRLTLNAHRCATLDFIAIMNLEDERVPTLIAPQLPGIAALIDAMAPRFADGGRIFLVGAGTSGRLAVLDAAECQPTFGTTPEQVVGIIAGGTEAMQRSVEGAEDDEPAGAVAVADYGVGPLDSVIGLAASGSTRFVLGAIREANRRGALTGSICNVVNAPISRLAQHPIVVPTGPEVLTGSTRLKAGTAQKLILNMISTGVMLRIGKIYTNLMVDMQPTNLKLRERARYIVAEATGLSPEVAGRLLAECGGEMKTAIAAAALGLTPAEARERLAAAGGNLGRVVGR